MNTRRSCAALLITAVIMVPVAGCTAAGGNAALAASPSRPEKPDITVAAIPAADLAGLYIAQDQGLFARQGLQVTIEKIPSSQAIIADQLSGQVDISAGSYVPYISAQATGAGFRILAEASTLAPNTRALVVTGNSPIATLAGLAGKKIGVNGTNSIGTLLISALLSAHGLSPRKVDFVTDQEGFPAMPGQLRQGDWDAVFLAEPYITAAGEEYGEQVLADLDQGAAVRLPIDGYIATQAWARQHPRTAAAFTRAIEQGQAIANSDASAVHAAMAHYDNLPPQVTAAIALTGYPVGPVVEASIQRVATLMLESGMLGSEDSTEAAQRTLIESMTGPGS
jgi:NitT/TauT family transport system substrate-binding protein